MARFLQSGATTAKPGTEFWVWLQHWAEDATSWLSCGIWRQLLFQYMSEALPVSGGPNVGVVAEGAAEALGVQVLGDAIARGPGARFQLRQLLGQRTAQDAALQVSGCRVSTQSNQHLKPCMLREDEPSLGVSAQCALLLTCCVANGRVQRL